MKEMLGILGAGKLGTVLGQLATAAGYRVLIAGSGSPTKIELTIETLVPDAVPATAIEVCQQADIVILAIPLGKYQTLSPSALAKKLVIDAMNYWWEVDGPRPDLTDPRYSSSELVQSFLKESHVVKAFNHMGYHDLFDETRSHGQAGRKAIAIAGNEREYVKKAAEVIDKLGFDPVHVGSLAEGIRMEPGSAVFGANVNENELKDLLAKFEETDRGQEVLHARGIN
ncbi:dinucleotide-binding enzyme [Liquorilactobacillus aquaticus DSM 21051]|uniref:Dinucleotide-binding enzyme n=1 Tax=Liquorilactobacillus aquaticus DSM 21051 TaxID=1423725 RepID=A0A0R2D0G2_9LACO|nr:NAD(P)-binding domain-containing protein [Liquorilactobacillus aquaticus]KRM97489.1 dinucleotide-binding enzyme [Liquorilactobacillus aquaticus DSM 21051]